MIANDLSEQIELFISCRNIKDADVFSKSDPYVRVSYKRDFTQKQYAILGKLHVSQVKQRPSRTSSTPTSPKPSRSTTSSNQDRTSNSSYSMMTVTVVLIILVKLRPQ